MSTKVGLVLAVALAVACSHRSGPEPDSRSDRLVSLTLRATKTYGPSVTRNDGKTIDPPATIAVPDRLTVTVGNAGNHQSTLVFARGDQRWTCRYKGGSDQAHPNSPDQIARGLFYHLQECAPAIGPEGILADRVELKIGNGDSWSPSRTAAETTVEVTLSLGGGLCAGVESGPDGLAYPASAAIRARFGIARWRVVPSSLETTPGWSVVGEGPDRQPKYYGLFAFDPTKFSSDPNEPSAAGATSRVFAALDGTPLDEAEQQALADGALDDGPAPSCLGPDAPLSRVEEGLATSRAKLEGEDGKRWTCEAERKDFAAAPFKSPVRRRSLSNLEPRYLTDPMSAWPEYHALRCCQGDTSVDPLAVIFAEKNGVTIEQGPQCGCPARTAGKRPIPSSTREGFFETAYACEACPRETPVWNGTRCEACPAGTEWNVADGKCGPPAPPPGQGPTTWSPNTTGKGLSEGCWYRVKLEFLTDDGTWQRYYDWYPNFYSVYNVEGADGLFEHSGCFEGACERQNNILVRGPVYGVGASVQYDRDGNPTSSLFMQDGRNGLVMWSGRAGWCGTGQDGNQTCWVPFRDVRIADIDFYDGPAGIIRSCGILSPCDLLQRAGVSTQCSIDKPAEPTVPFPPPPGGPTGPDPSCKEGEVPGAAGGCVCDPNGPPRNKRGLCECDDGRVWDPTARRCRPRGAPRCFGAVGEDCTAIQNSVEAGAILTCPAGTEGLPPGGASCLTDVHWNRLPGTRLQHQAISVGSIQHDQCCANERNGFRCGGDDSAPTACFAEFARASGDVLGGRVWRGLFDLDDDISSPIFVGGALGPYGRRLRAPAGTPMSAREAAFCTSGTVVEREGRTICGAPEVDLEAGTVGPINDEPTSKSVVGTCAPYSGAAADLELQLRASQSQVATTDFGDGFRDFQRALQREIEQGDVWVFRDGRGTAEAVASVRQSDLRDSTLVRSPERLVLLAAARDGAGERLQKCMLEALDERDRLPVASTPFNAAWALAFIQKARGTVTGTYDPARDAQLRAIYRGSRELNAFALSWSRSELRQRNIECIEGIFAYYVMTKAPGLGVVPQVQISEPFSAGLAPRVVLERMVAGAGPDPVISAGLVSYGLWDRYRDPAVSVPSIRFTDRNHCETGRPVRESEDVQGFVLGRMTPEAVLEGENDSPWGRLEVFTRPVTKLNEIRTASGLPALKQAYWKFDADGDLELRFHGRNAPGGCGLGRGNANFSSGRRLEEMKEDFLSYWISDCSQQRSYLDEADRSQWEVSSPSVWFTVGTDGLLRDRKDGRLLGTGVGAGGGASALWILSVDGRLFLGRDDLDGPVNHSEFMAGNAVLSGGIALFRDGRLIRLNNASGHYQPNCRTFQEVAPDRFEALGISTAGVQLDCPF
jgi:hypothetical protein